MSHTPRTLPQIIAHMRAVVADPRIDTTLIQTEDVTALCDAAQRWIDSQKAKLPPDEYNGTNAYPDEN